MYCHCMLKDHISFNVLVDSSRLGCQICVRDDMAGMKVRIPKDGF